MNSVDLIGRLTRDPVTRYSSGSQTAVTNFTIAVDRPAKNGEETTADFPRITVIGRQAENCERYLKKGRLVAVHGSIQTGSYTDKNGNTVYTTDVLAGRVEFLPDPNQSERHSYSAAANKIEQPKEPEQQEMNYAALDDDMPF